MYRELTLLACIVFGLLMLGVPAYSQVVEFQEVHCAFNLKDIRESKSLMDFMKKSSKCEVKVKTEFGDLSWSQPLVLEKEDLSLRARWNDLWKD